MRFTRQLHPNHRFRSTPRTSKAIGAAAILLASAAPAFAQGAGSPWENAVNVLKNSFTGPIAAGLSLVAIVIGGLMFAYGEGQRGLASLFVGRAAGMTAIGAEWSQGLGTG